MAFPGFLQFKKSDFWGVAVYLVLLFAVLVYTVFISGIHGGDSLFLGLLTAWPAVLIEWLNDTLGLGLDLGFLTLLFPIYFVLNLFLALTAARAFRTMLEKWKRTAQ